MPKHVYPRPESGPYAHSSGPSAPLVYPRPLIPSRSAPPTLMPLPPPFPFAPPLMVPFAPLPKPVLEAPTTTPSSNLGSWPSAEYRACLPFFTTEVEKTQHREPTDIVIVDFDRTLLASPSLNRDMLTAQAYSVLESKLEWGHSWWQSAEVLRAAIDGDQWDPAALEITRAAAAEPSALLVITTKRMTDTVPLIREALARQGITAIDHISSLPTEEVRGPISQHVMLSKGHMLELLLDTYDSLERIYVIDGNHKTAPGYLRAANKFSNEGWFNPEALYVVDKAMNTLRMPATAQRALIRRMLERSTMVVESHVLGGSSVRKLDYDSRKRAILCLLSLVANENDIERVFCTQADMYSIATDSRPSTAPGSPPPGSPTRTASAYVPHPGTAESQLEEWRLKEFEVVGKQCRFLLVSLANPSIVTSVSAARLKSPVNTSVTSLIEQEVLVTTYTYESRRLDLIINNQRLGSGPNTGQFRE